MHFDTMQLLPRVRAERGVTLRGMLFIGLRVGVAPLALTAHRVASVYPEPLRPVAVRMAQAGSTDHEQAAIAYAGIFAQSPGISRAWALPRQGSETLMVQRTARDIEGGVV